MKDEHSEAIAKAARDQLDKHRAKLNSYQSQNDQVPTPKNYHFTIICNNCGSLNVSAGTWYNSRTEDSGTYLKCQEKDCEQKEDYV